MTTPRSTYRLQLHAGFGFDDATAIVGYLGRLGISHVYTSPILQAAPGSTHGYDVVDHSRVNDELGGAEGHARFCAAAGAAGLGQVLDIVPNHMAIGAGNEWWWDVLENGPHSPYASYFDVDWNAPEAKLRSTVLLPVLGDHYGRVLDTGELCLAHDAGRFTVQYHDHIEPAALPSLAGVLAEAGRRAGSDELEYIALALDHLPDGEAGHERLGRRHQALTVLRRWLDRLCAESEAICAAIDAVIAEVNADADRLSAVLDAQHYRLARWQTASTELDYRRFFDIDTLVALRAEKLEVFEATHRLVLDWLAAGVLDGIRVDHIDGLRDPAGYCARLRGVAPEAWIVVEKILEHGEAMPLWPVDGTTGYDAANDVLALFVDPAGEAPLVALHQELADDPRSWDEHVRAAKLETLSATLGADLNRLTQTFVNVCEGRRRYRDFTRHELHDVLREVLVAFPVYRTYVGEQGPAAPSDQAIVDEAIEGARAHRPDLDAELLGLLRAILLAAEPDLAGPLEAELRARFQQLSGPVMAKSVEDTAFYRFTPLLALNEVGGSPGRWGLGRQDDGLEGWHAHWRRAQQQWPRSMLALSTHDTKRSEDVRARLALLSERPDRWAEQVRQWRHRNAVHRRDGWPDGGTEHVIYQTLLGAHPLPLDRLLAYMLKAVREAKVFTSWTAPHPAYEEALETFLKALDADHGFQAELAAWADELRPLGRVTSMAQKLVELTVPGVPDTYQGTEVWDLSLVDPDNRRPVDYERRSALLEELVGGLSPEAILERADEGLPKLWLVHRALQVRAARADAFGPGGDYEPLAAGGSAAEHVVAFVRGAQVAVVVPRLVVGLTERGWEDTTVPLPDGSWRNELTGDEVTGGAVRVGELLARFPVALLTKAAEEAS